MPRNFLEISLHYSTVYAATGHNPHMYEYNAIDYGVCSILELPITPEMVENAKARRNELPRSPTDSIMDGTRTEHGLVGEEMVLAYLTHQIRNDPRTQVGIQSTYDYDIILYTGVFRASIDVKTKVSNHVPHHDWSVSVAAANITQKCDSYCFTRVFEDYSRGFLVGFKGKSDYFDKAEFLKRGQMDYDNMYRVRADCYNMRIYELD